MTKYNSITKNSDRNGNGAFYRCFKAFIYSNHNKNIAISGFAIKKDGISRYSRQNEARC